MSLHASLKRAENSGRIRSVWKKVERIKWLLEKGVKKEELPIYGLPKVKIVKMKAAKKSKAKQAEEKTEGEKSS